MRVDVWGTRPTISSSSPFGISGRKKYLCILKSQPHPLQHRHRALVLIRTLERHNVAQRTRLARQRVSVVAGEHPLPQWLQFVRLQRVGGERHGMQQLVNKRESDGTGSVWRASESYGGKSHSGGVGGGVGLIRMQQTIVYCITCFQRVASSS